MTEVLELLLRREEGLLQELKDLQKEIAEERHRLIYRWHEVQVGSIVKQGNRTYMVMAILCGSCCNPNQKPPLEVVQKRHDGTWGVKTTRIQEKWEVVEP